MASYKCYLMNVGHVIGFEDLEAETDGDAVRQGKEVYFRRQHHCSTFEIWDRTRVVYRHDEAAPTSRSA